MKAVERAQEMGRFQKITVLDEGSMTSLSPTGPRVPSVLVLVMVLVVVQSRWARAGRPDRAAAAVLASEEYVSATVNASVMDARGHAVHVMSSEDGTYGQNSPKVDTRALLVVTPAPRHGVVDRQGCDPNTRFVAPPRGVQWVALLQRGNCTFREKILKAATFNASAVLIYNNSTNKTVKMGHEGTGDTVAVMITEGYGKDILAQLERNLSVVVTVFVGQRIPPKNINRGSLVFVSISFIVLMIISSAWLIFYFIQKIRYGGAPHRGHRRLGDAAKKAIGKLSTRTVKKGDKETDPDFNHCAVCIESYQLNDVVRILPCKHVFHKACVDPWLNEHCTCPMCKLNILKALGISGGVPYADSEVLNAEHPGGAQASAGPRAPPSRRSGRPAVSLEPLSPPRPEAPPLSPADIAIAVTSGHFFTSTPPPRTELPDLQAPLDLYDDKS
ncbi:E3 ubiquitin-protein ligase RNF130 isoform X1 [Syngnathus scovelli]|uniref:E3 ubiquitin-protein ligase RNF130 isoform X1 n=2 Tax=Syngnathus scovelli TaxID=161590 RepID=UPI0021106353|nr:E3 ubiquitin-protein ligase RNF130 isoform X1 [Syngnathus scovelli]XP_049585142.1 E3 ubiquitin-protein ligase RNF130 isoform X1 [Syngnathus scovelli]